MLLHELLLHAERYSGGRLAIVDGDVRRNYAELGGRVRRAAAGLDRLGLAPGDHIAVLAMNGSFFFEAYFALSMAGLVAVPVNTRLSPAEIEFILSDANCRAVLADDACAILIGDSAQRRLITVAEWEEMVIEDRSFALSHRIGHENDVAQICYTGGTTGRPKGVMLSHRNVVASTFNKIVLGGFARDDVWLHAAPMFHQADSWACFAFTAVGATHVFVPKFEPDSVLDMVDQYGVTALQIVPTMILMMLESPNIEKHDRTSLRRILYGSAPMPVDMLRRCNAMFGPIFQHIYGLTEAAGTVATTPWPADEEELSGLRMASCGQPIVGVEMRIKDDAGSVLTPGEIGRIQVKGANVMLGYWNRPEETAAALEDGWLDTGDLGRIEDDGFVYIVDRAKDMIISGGENIYSTEVENVLHEFEGVLEAAVIGIPDDKWGEAVSAVVVKRAGVVFTEADLNAHCRERLAGYKCPKSIKFVRELPKSAAGKILKPDLRAAFTAAS